jgi:peptide deformylase
MSLLNILQYPDPRLRTTAKLVAEFDAALQTLTEDMLETMYEAPGIGLAATQVDIHQRIIVIDISDARDAPYILINPELTLFGDPFEAEEGCLSVPGFYETVLRAERIAVVAKNVDGSDQEFAAEGMLAVCIQHECDHLEGKLFVDYLSGLKRNRIRKKLVKQQKLSA